MTHREIVDEVIVQIRANNVDAVPPRRYILSAAKAITTTLISQKLLERTLSLDTYLFTTLHCISFKSINSIQCPFSSLRGCKTLMKSVKPLPKPIFSRLGSSIKNIRSIDGGFEFTITQEGALRRRKNRKYTMDDQVFVYLGTDMHLYIADEEIYNLSLDLITLDTEDCDCEDNCKSAWDYEFKAPDRFLMNIIDETVKRLVMHKQMPEDQNPNNVEGA